MKIVFTHFISYLITFQVFAIDLKSSQQHTETKVSLCKVYFAFGTNSFDKNSLNMCIQNIPEKSSVYYINIDASASFTGKEEFNQKLTDQRVQALAQFVKKDFPYAIIETISIGKSKIYDRTGVIRFVSFKEKVLSQQTKIQKRYYFSIRNGRDIYLQDVQVPYYSLGVEGGLQYHTQNNVIYEFAAQSSLLRNEQVLTLYTFYCAPGISYKKNGLLLETRGLFGSIQNTKNQTGYDLGAEIKFGYEYKKFFILLDLGRTKGTIRFGANIGLII
jgi:hypothetical protein